MPRPIPPYEKDAIRRVWFYCLYCKHGNGSQSSLEYHLKSQHDVEVAVYGEDFTNGTHLITLRERWERWSLTQVDDFRQQLDSLRGADDLLLDIGDGLKDE